jgi:ribosomal protein S18 acetylase RimI-like enzyme
MEICEKLRENYRHGGLSEVLKRSVSKISYLLYHSNNAYWFRLNLGNELKEFPSEEGISVHDDNPDETIQYIRDHGYYYPMEITTGIREKHLYTNLKSRSQIIGYNKTGFSRVYITDFGREYLFPEDTAFTYDTYVHPEYRNRNYGAFLLNNVCRQVKKMGYKSIWGHIPPWNTASVAMHQKVGFVKQRRINYYWVAGISWMNRDPIELIRRVEDVSEK